MGTLLVFLLALGAGAVVIWILVQIATALFGLFLAMLSFIAMIVTGKWLWDFITKDDDEDSGASAPPK